MRRSYISPEYKNSSIYGTYNMIEESNFFSSKMLDIEDDIYISNQNIIFYQKPTGEQIDIAIESSLKSYSYSASDNLSSNHILKIDESQFNYQKDSNTKWNIEINLKDILSDYLFAVLKKYRTFEGISNDKTKTNDVNTSIISYIENNVLNRYKFSKIDLYISYNDLRGQNVLRYKNNWNGNILFDKNLLTKVQVEKKHDDSKLKLSFTQEKSSSNYNFDYYFAILFEKI